MDTRFALAVRRLADQDIAVPQIAAELRCTEAEVMAALGALYLPLPGERQSPPAKPSDEARAANRERVPQKWRRHYARKGD